MLRLPTETRIFQTQGSKRDLFRQRNVVLTADLMRHLRLRLFGIVLLTSKIASYSKKSRLLVCPKDFGVEEACLMFIFLWYHLLNSNRRLLLFVRKMTASVSPTDHRARVHRFASSPPRKIGPAFRSTKSQRREMRHASTPRYLDFGLRMILLLLARGRREPPHPEAFRPHISLCDIRDMPPPRNTSDCENVDRKTLSPHPEIYRTA